MELAVKLGVTCIVLHLLSWVYNALVAWAEAHGYHDGYVSLFVVGGVLYTLAGAAWIIGLDAALMVAALFAASGTPMVIGSVARHIAQRRREELALHEQARRRIAEGDYQ